MSYKILYKILVNEFSDEEIEKIKGVFEKSKWSEFTFTKDPEEPFDLYIGRGGDSPYKDKSVFGAIPRTSLEYIVHILDEIDKDSISKIVSERNTDPVIKEIVDTLLWK